MLLFGAKSSLVAQGSKLNGTRCSSVLAVESVHLL